MPTSISQYESISSIRNVKPMAIAMPTAAIQFPERAVRGCASRLTPMISKIAATR